MNLFMQSKRRGDGKKRVIFVTREGYTLSGARVRCYGFARELQKHGMETHVFSFADHGGALYGEREKEMSSREKLRLNVLAFKKLKALAENSFIFMQRFNYHSLAPFILSLKKNNTLIFDVDDWDMDENPRYYCGIFPSSKMEFLVRVFARYSGACVASSRYLYHYLKQFNGNVFYIPTGVDCGKFSPSERSTTEKTVHLSWAGTAYHPEMGDNITFILDCFSALAPRNKNIVLHLAGGGEYFDRQRLLIERHPFRDMIRVDGWIPPDEMPGYLAGMDIGYLPLIQDTRFNKAKSPTRLFEYMAMAKPVIASRTGEARKVIIHNKTGFLAEDKENFISYSEFLINDAGKRSEMGNAARAFAEENYSLHVLGERLYAILRMI
ncbi:MAG: glycosyltransferase [Candidatus Omnitrophica bacterium]|nr:glycosyltransferase [Candidatus Omnitrophota bacterium]